jgi:hypothetical protein
MSTSCWRLCLLLLSALAGTAKALCVDGGTPAQYAPLDAPPITQATRDAPAGAGCFEHADSATLWITVSSLVRASGDADALIGRFGAISRLLSVSYWSTTDQKWQPLVTAAHATTLAASSLQPRPDYSPAELTKAEDRYYEVTDNRSSQAVTYRLRLRWDAGNLVVETSNVSPVKKWGITLFAPGGLHTLYFLSQRSPGVWAYYSITRVLPNSFLAAGHEKSYINRAVALYRYFTQHPTDAEPPAAR